MITKTSLSHPTMIAKIRLGMRLAALGKGDQMNGHGTRVYVANAKGHNIMRIDWHKRTKAFVFYGSESRRIEPMIREAFRLSRNANV